MDGKVISRELCEGDWCILVNKTCIWEGFIQPYSVMILDDEIPSSTLSFPIYMCGPYGANYDDDEMTMYPVYSSESVREFESFK